MADLLYTPIAISSFAHNIGTQERGATVTELTLSWSLNKVPETLKLGSETLTPAKTGSRKLTGLAITAGNASGNRWTLTATDERDKMVSKTTNAVSFLNCVYYGAADEPETIDSAFIRSLATKTSPTSTRVRSINVAGGGKYIWYCLPTGLGTCTFKSGGFPAGIELADTIAFTNALGYAEYYYVYRSNQKITDTVTIEVS